MAPPPLFLPTFRPCAQLGSQCGKGPLGGRRKAGRAQDHSGGREEDSRLGGTGLGWLCSETSHLHRVTGFVCISFMLLRCLSKSVISQGQLQASSSTVSLTALAPSEWGSSIIRGIRSTGFGLDCLCWYPL